MHGKSDQDGTNGTRGIYESPLSVYGQDMALLKIFPSPLHACQQQQHEQHHR